jgi:hypothetical protein
MRRPLVSTMVCAAVLLAAGVTAGAAAAATVHKTGGPAERPAALRAQAPAGQWRAAARPLFTPAPLALEATATIDGTVTDAFGGAVQYAHIVWSVGSTTGTGSTDALGHYLLGNVPPAAGDGRLTVTSEDGALFYDWWNVGWAAPGPTTLDMRAGAVRITGRRGGMWSEWVAGLTTDTYTSAGGQSKEAWTYLSDLTTSAAGLPGTVDGMAAYFYDDEGTEITDVEGQTLSAGQTLPQSVTAFEASAQRVWTGGATWGKQPWGSGKPGSRLRLWLENFPDTWTNAITGYSLDPRRSAPKDYGAVRSLGEGLHSRTLAVPTRAVPGYGYRIWLDHTDGPLQLATWFQVCTLTASKTTVHKGTAIRFSGVIPVQGHSGATAGRPTKVYLYVHRGTARQPTSLDPRRQGWQYAGAFRTNGYGRFRSPLLRPLVTLSAVILYPGDNWYYAGYTSPRKIVVR